MRALNFLLFSFGLLLCLSACKKSNLAPAVSNNQPLIVGKWNLQQQTYTEYTDGVKGPDQAFTASHADSAYVRFDNGGNYLSVNQLIIPTSSSSIKSADSLAGTYTYSPAANKLALSGGLVSSLYALVATYPGIPAATDYIEPVSDSVQITQLTPKQLTLHFEVVSIYHYGTGGATNYKTVSDLYYNK
jgi:hypothetical protein